MTNLKKFSYAIAAALLAVALYATTDAPAPVAIASVAKVNDGCDLPNVIPDCKAAMAKFMATGQLPAQMSAAEQEQSYARDLAKAGARVKAQTHEEHEAQEQALAPERRAREQARALGQPKAQAQADAPPTRAAIDIGLSYAEADCRSENDGPSDATQTLLAVCIMSARAAANNAMHRR